MYGGGRCFAAWVTKARTFVLQEIAHACTAGQHQLGDILDDFGLILGRKGREPFREALDGKST